MIFESFKKKSFMFDGIPIAFLKLDHIYHCDRNLTSNTSNHLTILNMHFPKSYIFSYQKSIMEYFLCKRKMLVQIKDEPFENQTLALALYKTGIRDYKTYLSTTINQIYLVEIMSALKQIKDISYLSFVNLFDISVWFNLFLFSIIISVLLKNLSKSQFSYSLCFNLLMKLYTNQSTNLSSLLKPITNKIDNIIKSHIIVALIIIWTLNVLIITKEFSGVLLNTYFNVKPVPIVDSIEDIQQNNDLLIYGRIAFISYLNNSYLDSNQTAELIKRTRLFYDKFGNSSSQTILNELVQGNIVIIANSIRIENHIQRYKKWKNMLSVSKHKYLPDFATLKVRKDHPQVNITNYLFNQVNECGFTYHYNLLNKIIRPVNKDSSNLTLIEESAANPIELGEIFSNSILLLIIGLSNSSIVLICELSKYSYRNPNKQFLQKSVKLGQNPVKKSSVINQSIAEELEILF